MKYRVMVRKYGYADIEAANEKEARKKTDNMWDGEFDWAERDWQDAEIVDRLPIRVEYTDNHGGNDYIEYFRTIEDAKAFIDSDMETAIKDYFKGINYDCMISNDEMEVYEVDGDLYSKWVIVIE